MDLRGDGRGQSIQVGAILIFGILIVFFSTYQAFVVPQQNAEVESEHQQVIDRQMQELRNAIVSLPGAESGRSVALTLGTTYPARIIALNPPPPSGTVRTVGTGDESINLTLANANATDDETRDFWDENRSYNTGAIAYAPNYHEYENPPAIIYENTVLYKEFRSGNFTATGQRLVDGKRLTLVTLNGSLDRGSGETVSLDVEAVSASTTSIQITNETGENVTLRVASQRSADTWRDIFEDDQQFTDQGGHVVRGSVTETALPDRSFDIVTVELEQDVRYSLRMAKAGVGSRVATEAAAYLTDVSGDGATVTQGNSQELVVEARDRYNNPVGGVEVFGDAEEGSLDEPSKQTDVDGQVSFTYDSSGVSTNTDDFINFSILGAPDSSFEAGAPENVTMAVIAQSSASNNTSSDNLFTFVSIDKSKNGEIIFNINNTSGDQIVITEFSVDLTSYGNYRGKEVKINPDSGEQTGKNNARYDADGEFQSLNQQEAKINSGSDTSVKLNNLENADSNPPEWDLDNLRLQETNEQNSDVTVEIKTESGTIQKFYFEES